MTWSDPFAKRSGEPLSRSALVERAVGAAEEFLREAGPSLGSRWVVEVKDQGDRVRSDGWYREQYLKVCAFAAALSADPIELARATDLRVRIGARPGEHAMVLLFEGGDYELTFLRDPIPVTAPGGVS